jgi:hypothetical protein
VDVVHATGTDTGTTYEFTTSTPPPVASDVGALNYDDEGFAVIYDDEGSLIE